MRDFHLPGRSAVYATNGMVATSHPLATQLAVETLKRGGNAVDAAIAGAVLLGLCEPQMTGLGGDCFVLLKPAGTENILALNGSGRSPTALSADVLRTKGHDTVPLGDVASVTLPGAVDAFCSLSERHGKLGIEDTLTPLVPYFQDGVPVAPRVAFDWIIAADRLQGTAREVYLPWGRAPDVGAQFALPRQAEVLRLIAQKGRAGFYDGAVAEDMLTSLAKLGGHHTPEDFAQTQSDWTDPIAGSYQGVDLIEHPPNGQGATALLMGKILSHFDIAAMAPFGAQRAHIEAEAAKLAYDARNRFIADPDYTARLDHMLSDATAAELADLIDPKRAMQTPTAISEAVHKDTIYITVVDKDRMAVSLIYSIFHSFGAGLASEKFGILFQNRGAGFTLEPGHANELSGGKRPMHTIIPGMLAEGGRVTAAFGVMGGAYQPNGHIRFLSNLKDFGLPLQAAIDAPRSFAEGDEIKVERGYSDAVRAALVEMGHTVVIPETAIGGAQAIRIDAGGYLEGASDPRKDGCALGY